jgi:hypothetical protein
MARTVAFLFRGWLLDPLGQRLDLGAEKGYLAFDLGLPLLQSFQFGPFGFVHGRSFGKAVKRTLFMGTNRSKPAPGNRTGRWFGWCG